MNKLNIATIIFALAATASTFLLAFSALSADFRVKQYTNMDDYYMEIVGSIGYDDYKKFLKAFNGTPHKIVDVWLTSQGGSPSEAAKIANHILKKNRNTVVEKYCQSACMAIFTAGKKRWAFEGVKLGVHQIGLVDGYTFKHSTTYHVKKAAKNIQEMNADEMIIGAKRGIKIGYYIKMMTTPDDQIYNMTRSEAIKWNVVTEYLD